jgi:hypothetical protein
MSCAGPPDAGAGAGDEDKIAAGMVIGHTLSVGEDSQ